MEKEVKGDFRGRTSRLGSREQVSHVATNLGIRFRDASRQDCRVPPRSIRLSNESSSTHFSRLIRKRREKKRERDARGFTNSFAMVDVTSNVCVSPKRGRRQVKRDPKGQRCTATVGWKNRRSKEREREKKGGAALLLSIRL